MPEMKTGLLWAVVFGISLVLTLRDFSGNNSGQPMAKEIPELKTQSLLPTLRFVYWRVFEDLSRIVVQRFPTLEIEGGIYPPPAWRSFLAKVLQAVKFLLIIITISGIDPFALLGIPTPAVMTYALQNKISFCLMTFLLGNLVEGQLLSTGAFEIYFNDMPVWSKLESKRIPQPEELLQIVDNLMKFKPGAPSFSPNGGGATPVIPTS